MLEFSDAPYQFFEAQPSKPLIWLGRTVNQLFVVPGSNHLVTELLIEGETEGPRECMAKGERILFVINHPSHSDPQVVTEIHRRLGIPSCFMAAYDVFLRGKLAAWAMQKLGNFSIDREGSDRKAMAAANEVLINGDYSLNIFPEGNVYLTNDRPTPFLDGTAFIALQAQKKLKETPVKVIPISLKFSHLTLPRQTVTERLVQLGKDSGHTYTPGVDPIGAVTSLGAHIVSDYLVSHGLDGSIDANPGELAGALGAFAENLVSSLESDLELAAKPDQPLVDRIRRIRSTIHQIKTNESDEPVREDINSLADKAILAFRIHGYLTPYLFDQPTVDRFEETVERIAEDFYSRLMPRTGPRRGYAHIHAPLDVTDYLEQAGGKLRGAVTSLTADMEEKVQAGIDLINEQNDAPGATPISELPD